ncbi:MAG: ATP-binding protein [Sphingomonadaceae bacterium]
MMTLTSSELVAIALFCGLWLAAAGWAAVPGFRRADTAARAREEARRLAALVNLGSSLPLVVLRGGGLEAVPATVDLIGLERLPRLLAELGEAAFDSDERATLEQEIRRAARSGGGFERTMTLPDGRRLKVRGGPAPPVFPAGSVLLWFADISDEAAREAALREEAEYSARALEAHAALIEAATIPVWYRGPDLRLAMVNRAYAQAVEAQNAAEAVERGIELVDEAARGGMPESKAAGSRGTPGTRTVAVTLAGERRRMRIAEVPAGSGIAGFAIDAEELEQARAELSRFVHAQRTMLDRLSAGVAHFAPDRGLVFWNQPFARIFSLQADWLADHPEFDRLLDHLRESGKLPEMRDFPEWKAEKRGWFTTGLSVDEEDWVLPEGRHLRVVAQPLPDGGLLLIFEDRTEQLQLASARDTLLRVRTATFDNLFEAIGVFAADGRLHLWNNRFREIWDIDEERLAEHPRVDQLASHFAARLKNPKHVGLLRELVRNATAERKQRSGRLSLTDGRDYEFAAVPLPDGNALFTMLDVTDSRRIEAALRERNIALEEADRVKNAFVANMSYELRTPLTSIAGFAEMLDRGHAGELGADAREYVAAILEAVARLGALIDNVLDLTQSESGSLLLADDLLDLSALCREAADEARPLANKKKIDLATDIGDTGPVRGDRKRLRQALDHLIRNALAHTGQRGRVLVHAGADGEEALIAVSDDGEGIEPAEQARVFDRFHRASTRGEGGEAGLGLPLVKQFIEAHGGSVALESRPGEGTTVTLRLPQAE